MKVRLPTMDNRIDSNPSHWKTYFYVLAQTWLAFFVASFCLAVYLRHMAGSWIITTVCMAVLYLGVLVACVKRTIDNLSIAALMLLIPIAPLLILLFAIGLLHLIQLF